MTAATEPLGMTGIDVAGCTALGADSLPPAPEPLDSHL